MFKHRMQNNQNQQRRPRGQWQDDDESQQNQNNNPPQRPTFLRDRQPDNHPNQMSNQQLNRNTFQPQQPSQGPSISLEERLLEDVLQPTGIAIKPSSHLLNDYCKRAKNLNRNLMYKNIMEKLTPFRQYAVSPEQVKMLTKCLYLIEAIVENKVEDLYEAFEESFELLDEIRGAYPNNRKIVEIINHIYKMYNPNSTGDGYANMSQGGKQPVQQPEPQKENANLLDIGGDDNNNQNNNEANQGSGVNLLDDIFGGGNNNNNVQPSNQPTNSLLDFGMGNPTNNNNNNNNNDFLMNFGATNNQNTQPQMQNIFQANTQQPQPQPQPQPQKKGFGFIKTKSQPIENIQPNPVENPVPEKKGFKFIKKNSENPPVIQQSPIEQPMMKQPDQNKTDNDLFSIFSNSNPSSNLYQLTPQQQTNTPIEADLTKIKQEPAFNREIVYQNTQALKSEVKSNDPFNFVNDMIKTKKK